MKRIIKFGKSDCQPCIELDNYLSSQGIEDYTKINPFEDFELGIEYGIKTVPVLILEDENGEIIKRVNGGIDRNIKPFEMLIKLYKGEE